MSQPSLMHFWQPQPRRVDAMTTLQTTPQTERRHIERSVPRTSVEPVNLSAGLELEDEMDADRRSNMDEDLPTHSDDEFLDDSFQESNGMEQSRANNRSAFQMSSNDNRKIQYGLDDEGGGEKENDPKTRIEARKLFASTERGLGNVYREIGEYDEIAPFTLPYGNITVRPWHLQPGRRTASDVPKDGHLGPSMGAFGDVDMANFCNNIPFRNLYAEHFFFPFDDNVMMRPLSTDIESSELPATMMDKNYTGKLLHFLETTHQPLELSKIKYSPGTLSESIVDVHFGLPGMNGMLNKTIMDGSYGGDEGKAGCVIWMVDWSNSGIIPTELLLLTQLLCEYLKGTQGDECCSGIQSVYTEFTHSGKKGLSKCQTEVRTSRMYNYSEAGDKRERYASEDLDEELLKKQTCYRLGKKEDEINWSNRMDLNTSAIIQERKQVNNPDQSGTPVERYAKPEDNWSTPIIDLWLFQEIVPALDAETQTIKHIGVYGLYVNATTTANDPLVVLDMLAQNRTDMHNALYKVFEHMSSRLGKNISISRKEMFGSDRAAASEMCCDQSMIEALFKFASIRGLRNLNFGGLRYNPDDKKEQKLWREANRHVYKAKKAHFLRVKHHTMENRSKTSRQANLPDLLYQPHTYSGSSFVAFNDNKMREHMEEYMRQTAFMDQEQSQRELNQWFCKLHSHEDNVFIMHGDARPYNNGIWIHLTVDGKTTEDEKWKNVKDSLNREIVQPLLLVPAIACWAYFKHQESNQLSAFFMDKQVIPDIVWLRSELNRPFSKLPPVVSKLLIHVGRFESEIDTQMMEDVDPIKQELLSLVGKRPHPLQAELANLYNECHDMATLSRRIWATITSHSSFQQGTMKRCRLKHYRVSAESIGDLPRILKEDEQAWKDDYKPMKLRLAQKYDSDVDLLNVFQNVPIFMALSEERLATELSFCNKYLVMDLVLNTIYQLRNEQGSYGGCLRMQDGGGSFKVLKHPDNTKHAANGMMPQVVDYKSPSAGADASMALLAAIFNQHLVHNSPSPDVRALHKFVFDVSMRHTSALNLAKLGGGAVQIEKGLLDKRDTKYEEVLGSNFVNTELNKMGEGAEHIGKVEAFLAHSGNGYFEGGGTAIREENWGSSHQFTNVSIEKIRNGIPLIFITGNRPCLGSGSSLCESGRITVKASSTQDTAGRILVQQNTNKLNVKHVELHDNVDPKSANVEEMARLNTVFKNWEHANVLSNGDNRKDIRMPDQVKARNNRTFFLWMRWQRGDISLLLCSLSHRVKFYSYTFRSSFTQAENALGELVLNMRRKTFPDKEVWHRNASGPLRSVVINGQHVQQIALLSLLYAHRKAQEGHPLDLHEAHQRAIVGLHIQAVSSYTLISGIHHWLSEFVMDHQLTVLSAYMLSTCGFQHYCPLHVLSLVLRGYYSTLKPKEQKQYHLLCSWLQTLVCSGMQSMNGPWSVPKGLIQTPTKEQLGEWMTYKSPASHNSIAMQFYHRCGHGPNNQPMPNSMPSAYFCNANKLIHSEHIKGVGVNEHGKATVGDSHVVGSSDIILGEMFGRQQMNHNKRLAANPHMKGYQNTTAFWNAAKAGMRLPFPNKENNDQFKLNFDPVYETGFFYSEIMDLADANEIPIKFFLMQSGMDLDVNMYDFLNKLMNPHLQSSGDSAKVWDGFKHEPVLSEADKMFAWKSCPHLNPQTNLPDGVEVNLCMRIVHGIFFQALMCKDWNTHESRSLEFKATVHLRNTSQITQNLMSLFIHNSFEPSMIPVNTGKLMLPAPAPYDDSVKSASIRLDPRLYVDQHPSQPNLLSCISRVLQFDGPASKTWRIVDFVESGDSRLIFTRFLEDCKEIQTAYDSSQIFPFPPESVGHIQHMMPLFLSIHSTYNRKNCTRRSDKLPFYNNFLLAMMEFCVDAQPEHQEAYQVCLTEVVSRLVDGESMEIPCVSFSNHLFVLQVRRTIEDIVLVFVEPVNQTHRIKQASKITQILGIDEEPFTSLPLKRDKTAFECNQLTQFLSHGLYRVNDEMIIDFAPRKERAVSSYLYPLVAYPNLIALTFYGFRKAVHLQQMQNDDVAIYSEKVTDCSATEITLIPADALFQEEIRDNCTYVCSLDDLRKNPTIAKSVTKTLSRTTHSYQFYACIPGVDKDKHDDLLWTFNLTHKPFFWLVFNKSKKKRSRENVDEQLYYRFNSIDELTFQAQNSNLIPKTSEEWKQYDLCWYMNITLDNNWARVRTVTDGLLSVEFYTYQHSKELSKVEKMVSAKLTVTADLSKWEELMLLHSECVDICLPEHNFRWGISTSTGNSRNFLEIGQHRVSYMSMDNTVKTLMVDFAAFSCSMHPEGAELWLHLNSEVYRCVLQKLKQQHATVALPIPKLEHEQLHSREGSSAQWLRVHYMLGSTVTDAPIDSSVVALVVAVTNKSVITRAMANKNTRADADSLSNMELMTNQYNLYKIVVPVMLNGKYTFALSVPEGESFHKYLMPV